MDVKGWSQNCLGYYEFLYLAESYFKDIQHVLRYHNPEFVPIEIKGSQRYMTNEANHSIFIKSMRNCSGHIDKCNDDYLLKEFYIGLATKADMSAKSFIVNLAKGLNTYFESKPLNKNEPSKRLLKTRKIKNRFRRNRVLEFKPSPNIGGLSNLWKNYDDKDNIEFRLNPSLNLELA